MSKITAILHHVDISLKEVNHVRTITNELGTHGLIYYDYLPQLVLGLLASFSSLRLLLLCSSHRKRSACTSLIPRRTRTSGGNLNMSSGNGAGAPEGTGCHLRYPGIHVLYAFQILQPLAPCQPSVVRDPQNVPVVLTRRHRSPVCQARMDIRE
ncbi:hypothetical protein V8E52_003920 [Russula decolorans]